MAGCDNEPFPFTESGASMTEKLLETMIDDSTSFTESRTIRTNGGVSVCVCLCACDGLFVSK